MSNGTPRPPRDIEQDAFYLDVEGATINPATQCALNKFIPLRTTLDLENPLDASVPAANTGRPDPLTRPEAIPTAQLGTKAGTKMFVPQPVTANPPDVVKVSLFYCVGSEMNRHGLEVFFESLPDRVLITVPGREAGWVNPAVAWGIGITGQQIDELFTAAGMAGQKWQVAVMAGYSTGYRGVNGTINNGLVPLDKLETLIFYDALFRGDEPAPGGNTALMLSALGPGVTTVVYDVTVGTPHPFSVTLPQGSIIIDLKANRTPLVGLIFSRILEKGVSDNYVQPAEVPAPFQTLINNKLPSRGLLASSSARAGVAFGGTLHDWANSPANHPAFAALTAAIINNTAQLIADRNLTGWPTTLPGGLAHDGFIPEFGWEYLTTSP